jgi:hypothetical protein
MAIRNSSFCPRLLSAMIAELNCRQMLKAHLPGRSGVVRASRISIPGQCSGSAALYCWTCAPRQQITKNAFRSPKTTPRTCKKGH